MLSPAISCCLFPWDVAAVGRRKPGISRTRLGGSMGGGANRPHTWRFIPGLPCGVPEAQGYAPGTGLKANFIFHFLEIFPGNVPASTWFGAI